MWCRVLWIKIIKISTLQNFIDEVTRRVTDNNVFFTYAFLLHTNYTQRETRSHTYVRSKVIENLIYNLSFAIATLTLQPTPVILFFFKCIFQNIISAYGLSGLGVAVNVINFHLNVYYAVILAWSLRYFFASMSEELPWSTCGNEWNSENCFVYGNQLQSNDSSVTTVGYTTGSNHTNATVSSVREFWE